MSRGLGAAAGRVTNTANILLYAQRARSYTSDASVKSSLARYVDVTAKYRVSASVNVRDQILRPNMDDGIPAQFVTENADCRLYWTLPMIKDIREVWSAAARSAFAGKSCNWGGIEAPSGQDESLSEARPGPPPPPTLDTVNKIPDPITRDPEWLAQYNVKAMS